MHIEKYVVITRR